MILYEQHKKEKLKEMIGYVRLLLATTVLLSHLDVRIAGLNPGVCAVVIFYMLAGGVVMHIWHDILPEGKGKLMAFYKDRCLRIFPLYIYVASLTLVFLLATSYGNPGYSVLTLCYNAIIIPLNYYMLIDSTIMTDPAWNLVPPAWSLGTELQAYILLPFALQYKRLRMALVILSVIIYMTANLAYINTDYFGYRLLPGVFFIFLLGGSLKSWEKKNIKWLPVLMFIIIVMLYLVVTFQQQVLQNYARETMLGIAIGIPLLSISHHIKKRLPYNRMAGALSYGIFLTHFLMIWIVEYTQVINPEGLLYYCTIILAAAITSWLGIAAIEHKIDRIRMKKDIIKK